MREAGYLDQESITPGYYWADLTGSKQRAIVFVRGSAPFQEIIGVDGSYPTASCVKFICRVLPAETTAAMAASTR